MNKGCYGCDYAWHGTCTYPHNDCPVMSKKYEEMLNYSDEKEINND